MDANLTNPKSANLTAPVKFSPSLKFIFPYIRYDYIRHIVYLCCDVVGGAYEADRMSAMLK